MAGPIKVVSSPAPVVKVVPREPVVVKVISGGAGGGGGSGASTIIWGEVPGGAIDGGNLSFTTAHPYVRNTLSVYLNGLRLVRTGDYIETAAQSFTFNSAPLPGDSISIDYTQP
jgi:hypothetical protein